MHWPSMTLRLKARSKFDRAMDMFFTRSGLEQASAEDVVARHRSGRYAGASQVADLCCGIGGDLIALAEGRRVLAVDRDPLQLPDREGEQRGVRRGESASPHWRMTSAMSI